MKLVSGFTSQPKQTVNLSVSGGQKAYLSLEYSEVSQSWFASISYGATQIAGRRVTCTLSWLGQWAAILGWDLVVTTIDGFDPQTVSALADGTTAIYLLDNEAAQQAVTSG